MTDENTQSKGQNQSKVFIVLLVLVAAAAGSGWFLTQSKNDQVGQVVQIVEDIVRQTPLAGALQERSTKPAGQTQSPTGANPTAQVQDSTGQNLPLVDVDAPKNGTPSQPLKGNTNALQAEESGQVLAPTSIVPSPIPQVSSTPSTPGSSAQSGAEATNGSDLPQLHARSSDPGFSLVAPKGVGPLVLYTDPVAEAPGAAGQGKPGEDRLSNTAQAHSLTPQEEAVLPQVKRSLSSGAAPEGGRKDDAVVSPTFVTDLASWLVDSYTPGESGGSSSVSLSSSNLRYGVGAEGLRFMASDAQSGRSSVLSYVYSPGMIQGLYGLYVESFISSMDTAAGKASNNRKALNASQKKDMFQHYARLFDQTAAELQAINATGNLGALVQNYQSSRRQVAKFNADFAAQAMAYEAARDQEKKGEMDSIAAQMQDITRQNEVARQQAEQSRQSLLDTLHQRMPSQKINENELLYLAEWVHRRGTGPQQKEATSAAAMIFSDMARRFRTQAK